MRALPIGPPGMVMPPPEPPRYVIRFMRNLCPSCGEDGIRLRPPIAGAPNVRKDVRQNAIRYTTTNQLYSRTQRAVKGTLGSQFSAHEGYTGHTAPHEHKK